MTENLGIITELTYIFSVIKKILSMAEKNKSTVKASQFQGKN